MNEVAPRKSGGEFLLYQAEDGRIRIETRMQEETVWLTQDQMAQLFGKVKSTINEHIKNIFKEGELVEEHVMRKFGNSEFSTKPTHYYNDFLKLSDREILTHAGTVSHEQALDKAREEYEKYRRKYLNDPSPVEIHFLEAVKELKQLEESRGPSDKEGSK